MSLCGLVVLIFRHHFAVVIRIFSTCSAEVLTFVAEFMSLIKSGCQRKPGKMLKMSTEGG